MVNPLVSHEDGGQAKGAVNVEQTLYTRAHGSESKERRQIDRQRERERERERRLKRRFTGAWTQQGRALLLRLYACEPRRRDIAPRDTQGGEGRGHRVGTGRAGLSM